MSALLAVLALTLSQNPQFFPQGWGDGTYCGGYQQGFSKGWCSDEPGLCPVPPPPPCPPPQPGKSGFADGQVRGWADGINAKRRLPQAGSPRGM